MKRGEMLNEARAGRKRELHQCVNCSRAKTDAGVGTGSGEKKGIHDLANCQLNCSVEQRRKSGQVFYAL